MTAITAAGGEAIAIYGDISTPDGAKSVIADAKRRLRRRLDVLINNAGILRDKTLLNMSPDMWRSVLDVHLTGTFLCTQAAAAVMREQGGGRIINTTSVSGLLGNFGQANYSAAKAGIYGLTRTTSIELQRYGIFVNAVAPLAKTRMTEDLPMFAKIEDTLVTGARGAVHLFLGERALRRAHRPRDRCGGRAPQRLQGRGKRGKYKESDRGIWTAEEISEHFEAIGKG